MHAREILYRHVILDTQVYTDPYVEHMMYCNVLRNFVFLQNLLL